MTGIATGVGTLLRRAWVRALIALLLVILLGVIFNAGGSFFKWSTHRDMFRQIAEYGILACGLTIVIIAAGIDLAGTTASAHR
jgi:ribose transport system permease protein